MPNISLENRFMVRSFATFILNFCFVADFRLCRQFCHATSIDVDPDVDSGAESEGG
jgi:hypothetical protein